MLRAASLSAVTVVLPALLALVGGCTTEVAPVDEVETSSSTLTSQAKVKTATYLDERAVAWVSKTDWGFVQGGRCVLSCHTTLPFMMVRSKLITVSPGASASTPAAITTVRGFVETRVNDWANVSPLYSWVAPASRGTESIVNAAALVADDAPTGVLSPSARVALSNMWAEQKPDGSFAFWDTFSLAPWENSYAGLWGAALADYTIGIAPESYRTGLTTEEQTKLGRLESYLRDKVTATPAAPLQNRAMILFASTVRADLLDAATKTEIANTVSALQAADGSWSASSLGFTVNGGNGALPHAYATAFFTWVLAQTGDTTAVAKGRAWLETHQRADGAWEAKSLNKPTTALNNGFITDAATAYAVLALTP